MKQDIKNIDFEAFVRYLRKKGQPPYRAKQVFDWLYSKKVGSFALMNNIPRAAIEALEQDFYISTLTLQKTVQSKDGTQKFLFALEDGTMIESVCIPHRERITLCLSTQVWCKYGCTFCASAQSGFVRNVTKAELANQIIAIANTLKGIRVSNIVFMGIGEPLDNYENVLAAVALINAKHGFAIGQRKITISTAGVVTGIKRLAREGLQIELSVSLHSADEKKRSEIMPINKKYPLTELIPALKEFVKLTKRKITFEYMLLGAFNTGERDAALLVKTIKGIHCTINLIPFNPVAQSRFSVPTPKETAFFRDYLLTHHCEVTIRRPRGQDIEAACGQLRLQNSCIVSLKGASL